MGNEMQEMARNRCEVEKEQFDLETFWQFEARVCEQEIDYYEDLLRNLKQEIDVEFLEKLEVEGLEDFDMNTSKKKLTPSQRRVLALRNEVEDKYADKKKILLEGYERARFEEKVHHREKHLRKYEKMFERYAYPINATRFSPDDTKEIFEAINDNNEIVSAKD